MKLYVWDDVLPGSYGNGMIIVFAGSLEEAMDKAVDSWVCSEEVLSAVTTRKPCVYETAQAFCIRGSD